MIQLRILEAAALSIVEQADYFDEVASPDLARRWDRAVDEAILSLLHFPERGARCRFRSPELADLRWLSIPGFPKHMVFYRYLAMESAVVIVQVQYGARDLETILDPEA
jgi:plasmid stabilization system protein ParE